MGSDQTSREFSGFRAVFEAAPDGILIVDREGRIVEANPMALTTLGYSRDDLLGELVEKVVPRRHRSPHRGYRDGYMDDPHPRPMGMGMELRALRSDGREVPVEISLSPCATAEGEFVIAVVRDISERKRLRHLGSGTLQAAEDERRRIARELHDDTAQCLAALLIRLRLLRRAESDDARNRLLDEMQEELGTAVEGVRRISRGLRPPALDDAGVEIAVRSHLRAVLEPSALQGDVEIDPVGGLLDPDAQLVVYRVVQESMANVIRHAGANRVRVTMSAEPVPGSGDPRTTAEAVIRVTVSDDGAGFDADAQLLENRGLGLIGMQERARLVGGRLSIESEPGRGTRVILIVPAARPDPNGTESDDRPEPTEGIDG